MGTKYNGITGVAEWMGQPYENRFKDAQLKYLTFERESMYEILEMKKNGNTLIDTTGSFVHLENSAYEELKKNSLIVYIKASEEMKEEMFEKYIRHPKPVIWADFYKKIYEESNEDALKRCYFDLMKFRTEKYEQYADVTINYDQITDDKVDAHRFLELIKNEL